MATPVLECRGVAAGWKTDAGPRVVLNGVDLEIAAGESVVVLGGSGSGKSTLVRLFNRLDDALGGEVRAFGSPIAATDPLALRARVALVLQTPVMLEGTVRSNLGFVPNGKTPPTNADVLAALTDVSLDTGFAERTASDLSVGEKQRVAIARALVRRPDVLMLDEPTSALDPKSGAAIGELCVRLREVRGITLIVVTHQAELVRAIGGRRVLVADGRVDPNATDESVRGFLEAS